MDILQEISHYALTCPERAAVRYRRRKCGTVSCEDNDSGTERCGQGYRAAKEVGGEPGADNSREEEILTYSELWAYSGALAAWLVCHAGSDHEPIAVYGHKHPWMLVCFLACVRAGHAYCPIDISVPDERVRSILEALPAGLVFALEPLRAEALPDGRDHVGIDPEEFQDDKASAVTGRKALPGGIGSAVAGTGSLRDDKGYFVVGMEALREILTVGEYSDGCLAEHWGSGEKSFDSGEKRPDSGTKCYDRRTEYAKSGTACHDGMSDISYVRGDEIFYIIFTSGSTGTPKGVQITADCLNHYLDWSVGLGTPAERKRGQVFLNQAPFSFDLSVMDMYTCLACGGTLFLLDRKTQNDYRALMEALQDSEANVWVSTPSFAEVCLSEPSFDAKRMPGLELFLFCGETLANRTAAKLMKRFPDAAIVNTYGPTESTVAVTGVTITPELAAGSEALPVGRAKPGIVIEIRDADGRRVPDGVRGEVVIIGDTVSPGYYGRPELTEKAFFRAGETVESNQWSEGSGRRAAGSGECSVDGDQRAADSGECSATSGQWSVATGQQAEFSGECSMTSGQWALDGGQQAEFSGECSVASGQRSAESSQQPAGSSQQPAESSRQAAMTAADGQPSGSSGDSSGIRRGYRTGDEGWMRDGMLYYGGRIDLQIKLHGYRIELEDIENNIRRLPGVRHAVVVPHLRSGKVQSLNAFVVRREDIPAAGILENAEKQNPDGAENLYAQKAKKSMYFAGGQSAGTAVGETGGIAGTAAGESGGIAGTAVGETGGTAEKQAADPARQLRILLRQYLPDYMIPKKIFFLDQMPMTNNGKADRKRLAAMYETSGACRTKSQLERAVSDEPSVSRPSKFLDGGIRRQGADAAEAEEKANVIGKPVTAEEKANVIGKPVTAEEKANVIGKPVKAEEKANVIGKPVKAAEKVNMTEEPADELL